MGLHPAPSSPFRCIIARTFVIFWLLIARASGAVIMGDTNILSALPRPNMTQLQDALNISTSANDQRYHCTNRKEWIGRDKGFEITDCFNARLIFWQDMIVKHRPEQRVEYMGHHAQPTTRLEKVQTPLRFTSGKWAFSARLVLCYQGE